jgi:DNA-binding transcriptional LysR family regulator
MHLDDISPTLLRQFLTLSELGRVDAAAERLGIGERSLARALQRLERRLGAQLLLRGRGTLTPTEAGVRAADRAGEVLSALDRFAAHARAERGTLRVAHPASVDTLTLVLDELGRAAPDVAVHEATLGCDDQLAALRSGTLDVALCCGDEAWAAATAGDLVAVELRADALLAAVPIGRMTLVDELPTSVDSRTTSLTVADTRDWPSLDALVRACEERAGREFERVPVPAGSAHEIAALERAAPDTPYLLLSSALVRPVARRLVPLAPDGARFSWALVHRAGAPGEHVRALLAAARHTARERGWLAHATPREPTNLGASALSWDRRSHDHAMRGSGSAGTV